LVEGVDYVLERVPYLPILPISAEEKGLKTRFPTATLTAANMVQQILRRAIDHIMINDPRFSTALGGSLDMDFRGELGPWYSQDATAATDLHAEWLTRGAYEAVVKVYPQLSKYTKYFDKIFGTKKLLDAKVTQNDCVPIGFLKRYPRAPLLDDRFVSDDPTRVRREELGHASIILDIADAWLHELNGLPGVLTTTGQMMGDPTSFPPLMLHTLYAATETLKVYPYTKSELRAKYHRGLRKGDVVLKGVGDDAQKPRWTPERRRLYDEIFVSMGGRLSYAKCFYHPSRSIIAEEVYEHGYPVPVILTSTLVAPPGGSKGHITWNLQSAALAGDPLRPKLRITKALWRSSPYYYTWRLADRLGIPISCEPDFGGVGVPLVPHRSTTDHVPWLQFLSQLKVIDLIAGTGLAIGENATKSPLDVVSRQWLEQVFKTSAEMEKYKMPVLTSEVLSDAAEIRLSLKDAYRQALGNVRGAEFYFRAPLLVLSHNPSVRVAAAVFQRKVRKAAHTPIRGYGATKRDLDAKRSLYFLRPAGLLPDTTRGLARASYGMERSGIVRERWIAPHLRGLG
jgi:hypothetical protein